MGFLRLFKKREMPNLDLDIPPPPPLPELPITKRQKERKEEEIPLLPPLEPIILKQPEEEKLPEFPSKPEPYIEHYPNPSTFRPQPVLRKAPRFPPTPAIEESQMETLRPQQIAQPKHEFKPLFRKPETKATQPGIKPFVYPKEKEEPKREVTGPLFIRQDSYKAILDGVSIVKNKLKESEDLVLNLNNIKNNKDKEFERLRNSLEDIQRKLMYIDKTIYE